MTARLPVLGFVCSALWDPYPKVIRERATGALQVLDRFHLMAKLNKAKGQVRRRHAASPGGPSADASAR